MLGELAIQISKVLNLVKKKSSYIISIDLLSLIQNIKLHHRTYYLKKKCDKRYYSSKVKSFFLK